MMTFTKQREDVKEYILDQLKDEKSNLEKDAFYCDFEGSELPEKENFGETYTDLSDPEKIANMLSYILGNEILSDSAALQLRWDSPVNKNTLEIMIKEIELKK